MAATRGEYPPGYCIPKPTSGYSATHNSPLNIVEWIRSAPKSEEERKIEKPVSVGFIGCGKHARKAHAAVIAKFPELFSVGAVYDPN